MKPIDGRPASAAPVVILRRLADALGRPVSDFSPSAENAPDQTIELLRLWSGIERDCDRVTVLAYIEGMRASRGT